MHGSKSEHSFLSLGNLHTFKNGCFLSFKEQLPSFATRILKRFEVRETFPIESEDVQREVGVATKIFSALLTDGLELCSGQLLVFVLVSTFSPAGTSNGEFWLFYTKQQEPQEQEERHHDRSENHPEDLVHC